jgi:hypothetical protein
MYDTYISNKCLHMKKYLISGAISFAVLANFAGVAGATVGPPSQYPTDVDQCKDGGWESYNGMFKNQGDCVSFVVTDGRNAPDGPNAQ